MIERREKNFLNFLSRFLSYFIIFLFSLRYNLKIKIFLASPSTELRMGITFIKYFQLGTTPLILLVTKQNPHVWTSPLMDVCACVRAIRYRGGHERIVALLPGETGVAPWRPFSSRYQNSMPGMRWNSLRPPMCRGVVWCHESADHTPA